MSALTAVPTEEIGLYIGRYLRCVGNPENTQARLDMRASEAFIVTQFGYDAYLNCLVAGKRAWEALNDC